MKLDDAMKKDAGIKLLTQAAKIVSQYHEGKGEECFSGKDMAMVLLSACMSYADFLEDQKEDDLKKQMAHLMMQGSLMLNPQCKAQDYMRLKVKIKDELRKVGKL